MPDIRLCSVASDEDFTVMVVANSDDATLDAELVACGVLSDARVRIVTSSDQADEFISDSVTPPDIPGDFESTFTEDF